MIKQEVSFQNQFGSHLLTILHYWRRQCTQSHALDGCNRDQEGRSVHRNSHQQSVCSHSCSLFLFRQDFQFFSPKKEFFSGLELCTRDIQTVVEGESIKANKVKQNLKEKVTTVSRKQTSQKTLWYILEEQV